VEHVREEVDSLNEIPTRVGFLFRDEIDYTAEAREVLGAPTARTVLETFVEKLNSLPSLDVAKASSVLQELRLRFKEKDNLRAREVMFPVRASLTGALEGPSLAAVIALLGKERCIQRVRSSQDSS